MEGTTYARPSTLSLFELAWRRKVLVATVTLSAALLGFVVSSLQPTVYRSSTQILLKDPKITTVLFEETRQPGVDPGRFVRGRAQLMLSTPVMDRASQLLPGRPAPPQLRQQVTVEPAKDLDLLTVSAKDSTPQRAAAVVNAVGTAFREVGREDNERRAETSRRQLLATADALRTRVQTLEGPIGSTLPNNVDDSYNTQRSTAVTQLLMLHSRADAILADAAVYGDGVQFLGRAQPPATPAAPRPLGSALVAGFLGFLAAFGLAWWRAEHRQTADDRHDAAAVLGVPLLGEVPALDRAEARARTAARAAPAAAVDAAYGFLVTALDSLLSATGTSTVVVTGAAGGDGATATALGLGVAAGKDGRRVLLLDADGRGRGLTRRAGVPDGPGLTDLVSDGVPLPLVTATLDMVGGAGLSVIAAGRELDDRAACYRSGGFSAALTGLKSAADLIVVDCPPLLEASETSAIASRADGIVLVVRRGTPVRLLQEARERLAFAGAPLLGYVFTRPDPKRSKIGRLYHSRGRQRESSPVRPLARVRDRVKETV